MSLNYICIHYIYKFLYYIMISIYYVCIYNWNIVTYLYNHTFVGFGDIPFHSSTFKMISRFWSRQSAPWMFFFLRGLLLVLIGLPRWRVRTLSTHGIRRKKSSKKWHAWWTPTAQKDDVYQLYFQTVASRWILPVHPAWLRIFMP